MSSGLETKRRGRPPKTGNEKKVFVDGKEVGTVPGVQANIERLQGKKRDMVDVEEPIDKTKVLDHSDDVEKVVSMAKHHRVKEILVTKGVLKDLLREHYNNDLYLVYKGVWLYDVERVDEAKKADLVTTTQKIFGKSRVRMGAYGQMSSKA